MRKHILLLLLLLFTAAAHAQKRDTIRVLSIGNSYARDAFSYVPMLIEELSPETYVEFGILYIGGCTLQTQWANASAPKERPLYEFDHYTTARGRWTTTRRYSMQRGLRQARWDLIILQQQSYASMTYTTHQPYLSRLTAYLRRRLPDVTFAWHLTPSYPDSSPYLTKGIDSHEMWRRTALAAQQVMLHDEIAFVIPAGTALQNARATRLDRFGAFGHMSHEGLHTAEGIPCLVAAYTAAERILTFFGHHALLSKSRLWVSQTWVIRKNIPQRHGAVPATTLDDYRLARLAAEAAIRQPYRLTPIK